ncbi:hypothetical protein BVH03_24420 [Pseudomonas sp. PA15(2017)]|nr:hypothetical protein BVH03_24420 [Pseudomonas sp. PA15(2017)]
MVLVITFLKVITDIKILMIEDLATAIFSILKNIFIKQRFKIWMICLQGKASVWDSLNFIIKALYILSWSMTIR